MVQDDPKHHFGSILAPIWDRFWSILGLISEHFGIDVEMIFATKLDRNFGVPYGIAKKGLGIYLDGVGGN